MRRTSACLSRQDALHDAAFGERAAAGLAAGDEQRQPAGAVQAGAVAQALEAEAVEGVAAVFGVVDAAAAAEHDDGVGVRELGGVERGADLQAALQQAADPGRGEGVEGERGGADERRRQARSAPAPQQAGGEQDHQHEGRQQGGGDEVGDEPGGHDRDCMRDRNPG